MKEQLKSIDERAKEELSHIDDAKLLEDFRVRFLGKKGEITSILKQMGKLSAEERPVIGQLANKVRADIENALNKRKEELKSKMEQVRLTEEAIDVTLPLNPQSLSHQDLSTISLVKENLSSACMFTSVNLSSTLSNIHAAYFPFTSSPPNLPALSASFAIISSDFTV